MRWLTLALWACKGAEETDTDVVPDTDAASPAPSLVGGIYSNTLLSRENDTCAMIFNNSGLLPVQVTRTLEHTYVFSYEEQYQVSSATCTMNGAEGSCTGWVQNMDPATLTSVTNAFRITSNSSFDVSWGWTVTCEGGECAELAASMRTTFPCTLDVLASFETDV